MSNRRRREVPVESSCHVVCWFLARVLGDGHTDFYCYDDDEGQPVFGPASEAYWCRNVAAGKDLRDSLAKDGVDVSNIDIRRASVRIDVNTRWKPDSEMPGRS